MKSDKDNLWLYKSSKVFMTKLVKSNMISKNEYSIIIGKLKRIYNQEGDNEKKGSCLL
ncbi:hypothetical protein PV797_14015 [Clostridiaceae bacterium M8S5]|nr:hypothetical protein PV797_14015 [Clostridiaceae bacterium M8S5]